MSLSFLRSIGTVSNIFLAALGGLLLAGVACVAYGVFIERRWYRLATYRLELLPEKASSFTVLHLSDLHLVRSDRKKAAFIATLPSADVTVVTGDLIGEPSAVEALVAAIRPARGRVASYFVLGSNDYFAPSPRNYLAYFRRKRRHRLGVLGRSGDLIGQLEGEGWQHLPNRQVDLTVGGIRTQVVGLDDPHIERHDLRAAVGRDAGAFGLALVHSPDPAPELAALGYELILAGHTHGGQVRMPLVGALVTNGTTPTKLCMGLSRIGPAVMHVSPGLGTSKYAPFRFLCRPEATLLELAPIPEGAAVSRRDWVGTGRRSETAPAFQPETASS